jgi:hypothetical protein
MCSDFARNVAVGCAWPDRIEQSKEESAHIVTRRPGLVL